MINSHYLKLTADQEQQVRALYKVCVDHDDLGQDLFLDPSLNMFQTAPAYFAVEEGTDLVGFAFVFCPMSDEAEITAFVHPEHRRKGAFKRLLHEVCKVYRPYGVKRLLLVNDRRSKDGCDVVTAMSVMLHHTEYSMKHNRKESSWCGFLRLKPIKIDRAQEHHVAKISQIRSAAFEMSYDDAYHMVSTALGDAARRLYVGLSVPENNVIGASGIKVDAGKAYIFGLAIDPSMQGKGYGMGLVSQLLELIYREGVDEVYLDVDSINHRAYGLYKKCGFEEQEVIDYFESELIF